MPIEGGFINLNFVSVGFLSKIFLLLFAVFYSVFSLIIFRQVQLMEKALPLPLSPFLTFVAIVHIGLALAFFFIVLGLY